MNNLRRGGLVNFDCSEKLSYKVLDNLINNQWKTDFTENIRGGDIIEFNGFYGDYEVIIESEDEKINKKIGLSKKANTDLIEVF